MTHRRNLKRKFLDLENAIRHSLKAFGIPLNRTGRGGFAQAVREAVAGDALVTELIDAMLNAQAALWKEYLRLHDLVVKLVASHDPATSAADVSAQSAARTAGGNHLSDKDMRKSTNLEHIPIRFERDAP